MINYDENLIKITGHEVLGKLPDIFLKEDGTRISDPSEWDEHRKTLLKTAVELQYGKMPPKPENIEIETICRTDPKSLAGTYRIITDKINFTFRLILPKEVENPPVAVYGDMCFNYMSTDGFLDEFLSNGIAVACFNRCELAHDVRNEGRSHGQLYKAYPEHSFGALAAWAWGYSRVVDALEMIGGVDLNCLISVGHSRGGKTALLAGAVDTRFAIVNPNEACASGTSCYRIHTTAINENGEEKRSENLYDMWTRFGFWLGEGMGEYALREQDLPFDSHTLKALVAPRVLFVSEAASDIWGGPVGSWMTTQAASEAFKFVGKENNLYWYYRKGNHFHHLHDVKMLVAVIKNVTEGKPLPDGFFKTPFKTPELIYDWRSPR